MTNEQQKTLTGIINVMAGASYRSPKDVIFDSNVVYRADAVINAATRALVNDEAGNVKDVLCELDELNDSLQMLITQAERVRQYVDDMRADVVHKWLDSDA